MEKAGKRCFNCRNFKRYYTSGEKEFEKTNCGYCRKLQSNVNYNDGCDGYEYRERQKGISPSVAGYLHSLLQEIKHIRQVIEEENEEEL